MNRIMSVGPRRVPNLSQTLCRWTMVCLAVSTWINVTVATLAAADYHHVHLNATDPKAAAKWYIDNLGATQRPLGIFSAVGFDKTTIIFFQAKPGFAGSQGSSVDHIGFATTDLAATLKKLEAAGVEKVSDIETEGPIKFAFIKDPWGTLIELIEYDNLSGFHHVHLSTTDPQATLLWYTQAFGGEIAKFAGLIPGVKYGDMWVLAKKVDEPRAPTKGRAVDHLGWSFPDLDAAAVDLKAKGVKFVSGPYSFGNGKIAFILAPDDVLIELVGPGKPKADTK